MKRLGFERLFALCPTETIQSKLAITDRLLKTHEKVMCSVSGGADSDCMMHLVWNLDTEGKVEYWFSDTGIEMQATKNHLKYLEQLYGVEIHAVKPKVPCAASVLKHGYPFMTKRVADSIHRLQIHDFQWADSDIDRFGKSAHDFWCGENARKGGRAGTGQIASFPYLKEFMQANPPAFRVSDQCCFDCKKQPMHQVQKGYDVVMTGIRQAEGGQEQADITAARLPQAENIRGTRTCRCFGGQMQIKRPTNRRSASCIRRPIPCTDSSGQAVPGVRSTARRNRSLKRLRSTSRNWLQLCAKSLRRATNTSGSILPTRPSESQKKKNGKSRWKGK